MPRILLIDTNTTPFNEALPVYPIGLDYVQGALKEAGFADTHLLDLRSAGGNLPDYGQRPARSREVLSRKLAEASWDIIGIGIRNIDSTYPPDPDQLGWHFYLPQIKEYVGLVRERAGVKVPIILGGSGFSMMPDEILSYLGGDYYGVVGPAETVLPRMVADLLAGKSPPQLHRAAEVRIGKLQNLALLEQYKQLPQGMGTVGLRTRNGCGQHCGYCPYPGISGREITLKDVDDVLAEISRLRRMGFESFMFTDDIFNTSPESAKRVLAAMLAAGEVPRSWHAYLTPVGIDEELLELVLATNGWSYYQEGRRTVVIPFDLDSACDRILAQAGKGYTTGDLGQSLAAFNEVKKRHGAKADAIAIESVFHLLLGFPGEDEASVRESCRFINEARPERLSLQLGVRVYPHTPLAAETRGVLWREPADLLAPAFVPFSLKKMVGWLRRHLDPEYRLFSAAGNMVQFVRGEYK